jgi:hypothetical protein
MKKTYKKQPKHRLLKAGCVGAGLLSISNPTQVTAADIGILDVHDFGAPPVSLGTISNPFPGSTLGVHVAVGDIDGDGFGDIVIGPGKGATEVYIHRGKSDDQSNKKLILSSFSPGAGVRVATGDLDGDGLADIIATPATGASSRGAFLKFDGIKGELALLEEFDDIFDGPSGGVSVATGDLDGDGVTDIMAGQVTVNKAKMADKALGAAFTDFGDPLPDGNGGVQVAAGDVDGDGLADVLVLPNNSPTGLVQPLLATSKGKHTPWILLPSIDEPTGVHVALGDVDGDRRRTSRSTASTTLQGCQERRTFSGRTSRSTYPSTAIATRAASASRWATLTATGSGISSMVRHPSRSRRRSLRY